MYVGYMQCRRQQVRHDQDRQISWSVIGAVVKQFLTAVRARIIHLEVAVQQFTLAAVWAIASKSPDQGGPGRALFLVFGVDGLISHVSLVQNILG